MTDKIFYELWSDALNTTDRDAYVSDWGLSSIWEDTEESTIPETRISQLGDIWDVAHMSIKEICKAANLTQAALATRICAPKRTIENWCSGANKCPDYTRLLILLELNLISKG